MLLPDDDLDWADSGVVMPTIRYRGRRHRRRSCLVLVFGTQRHVDKFARHHGHSMLHQVENVLAVIEETDQMEGAERSGTPQSQIANHHRTLKMDEIIQN
jgi:hypothetical protein